MSSSQKTLPKTFATPVIPQLVDAARSRKIITAVAVASFTGLMAVGFGTDNGAARLSFAWLLNAWFALSLSVGAIAFVALQHITRAGWSVTLRRTAELLGVASAVPLLMLLILAATLWSGPGALFPWNDPEVVAASAVLQGKQAWLNRGFFALRTVFYAATWLICSVWLLRISRRQDRSRDGSLTLVMEKRSAPILIAVGLTITFAAFDWLMSIDPMWFSTIFGVYVFSGGLVAALAVLVLVAAIRIAMVPDQGLVTREHLHDAAKLLYGFNCFWAYIAFSQYLLIWYANIPEETIWYRHRMHGGWEWMSLLLIIGHFIIPFLILMPRGAKRSLPVTAGMAVWLLLMHWVDLYWLTYPSLSDSPVFGPTELLGLMFTVSSAVLMTWAISQNTALIPVSDPRLQESVSHHVV